MYIDRKTPVQNDTEETWSGGDPNFLIANEEGRLPSAVVGPIWKGTYLTFVSVQI